jgi:hypothetical protein
MASAPVAPLRRTALASLVVVGALALAGCVDAAPNPPDPTGSPTPRPTVSSPTTQPPAEQPEPLEVTCEQLVDAEAVYAFDPNFGLIGAYEPDAGSAAAAALDAGGIACRLVRESGSGTIDISVASLPESALTALKDDASASSEMVPTYGDEAYFDPDTGTATVFQGSYWLVVVSPYFAEPGEPTEIIDAALVALP